MLGDKTAQGVLGAHKCWGGSNWGWIYECISKICFIPQTWLINLCLIHFQFCLCSTPRLVTHSSALLELHFGFSGFVLLQFRVNWAMKMLFHCCGGNCAKGREFLSWGAEFFSSMEMHLWKDAAGSSPASKTKFRHFCPRPSSSWGISLWFCLLLQKTGWCWFSLWLKKGVKTSVCGQELIFIGNS